MRIIISIIFIVIGIAGSVVLLREKTIGELSFVSLCLIVLGSGLAIAFIDRVTSFGSSAFKVEFDRVEKSRKEIQKREKRVTEIARIISEVSQWNIDNHGLLFGEEAIEKNKRWLTEKNAELKALVSEE